MAFNDLLQQVYVQCTERGRVAKNVWQRQSSLTNMVIARMRDLQKTLEQVKTSYETVVTNMQDHYEGTLEKVHTYYCRELSRMQSTHNAYKSHVASLNDRYNLMRKIASERSKDVLMTTILELKEKLMRASKRLVFYRDLLTDSSENWGERPKRKTLRSDKARIGIKEDFQEVMDATTKDSQLKAERHITDLHRANAKLQTNVERLIRDEESLRAANRQQLKDIGMLKREIARLKKALAEEIEKRRKMMKQKVEVECQTDPITIEAPGEPEPVVERKKPRALKKAAQSVQRWLGWRSGLGLLVNMKNVKAVAAQNKTVQYKVFLKQIDDIYAKKIQADEVDDREDNPRQTLPEFVYDYFTNKYGLKALADQNVFGLMQTINQYRTRSFKIHLFGRFLCLYESLDLRALNSYLDALQQLKSASTGKPLEEVCPTGPSTNLSEKDTWACSTGRALAVIPNVFFPATQEIVQRVSENLVAQILPLVHQRGSIGNDSSPDLDLEQVLFRFLHEKDRIEDEKREALLQLFHKADVDGDGILTVDEFADFARDVNEHLSMEECERMHSEMLAQSGGPAIAPDVFVAVSLKYRLIADPEGTQLDTEVSEKLLRLAIQKNGFQAAFATFLRPKQELVTKDDFIRGMDRLGVLLTKLQTDVIFSRLDKNNDGQFDIDEFTELVFDTKELDRLALASLRKTGATAQHWFRQLDDDGQHKPVRQAAFVKKMSDLPDMILTPVQLKGVFSRFPKEDEEEINFTEFQYHMAAREREDSRQQLSRETSVARMGTGENSPVVNVRRRGAILPQSPSAKAALAVTRMTSGLLAGLGGSSGALMAGSVTSEISET